MKPGIGWNVPHKVRAHSRLGIALLMEEGDRFEEHNVRSLADAYGEASILTEGFQEEGGRRRVKDLPFEKFAEAFAAPPFPRFVAQLEVELGPEAEFSLLEYFGLDPRRVKIGRARPDLLLVQAPAHEGEPVRPARPLHTGGLLLFRPGSRAQVCGHLSTGGESGDGRHPLARGRDRVRAAPLPDGRGRLP